MGNSQTDGEHKQAEDAKQTEIPREYMDPIVNKIMANPVMILSSMNVYDEITIDKWVQSQRSCDPLTGIPLSIGGYPLLKIHRDDIKQNIEDFLNKHPMHKSQIIHNNDDQQWKLLFQKHDNAIKNIHANYSQQLNDLKKKAKQIFKPSVNNYMILNDQKCANDESNIIFDDNIILQPDIPVICIMGPSRNGKSTIINDILNVKDATKVSSNANTPETKGAWIALFEGNMDKNSFPTYEGDEFKYKDEETVRFYVLDMEGLSHSVTQFTKKLFYACYATSNLIVWNDKGVGSDAFKNLMKELKCEMGTVAYSDRKPAFLYLKRDAGDVEFDEHESFEDYIRNHDSFAWFREMNIFSTLNAFELERPTLHKKYKPPLNFHSKPENQQLLIPLVQKLIISSQTSPRFALNKFELQQQIEIINKSKALSVTKQLITKDKTLRLFLINTHLRYRRRDMVYVACEFNWDHKKMDEKFKEAMKKLKEDPNGDKEIIEKLETTKKEIYERVKNKIVNKGYAAQYGITGGASTSTVMGIGTFGFGMVIRDGDFTSTDAVLVSVCMGSLGFIGGYVVGKTREYIESWMEGDHMKYSLGRTDDEIEQDKKKADKKTNYNYWSDFM
eukprot:460555_1